ncbi:MAG: xanthine dehydrogenase family protein molybdopterin-binding subunit, partial [Rhodospirillaceae bacterium]
MHPMIGQPVRRQEDARLLTGGGAFSDDVSLPGQAHAVMVRSPHAHARIAAIDATAALAMPGVVAVLTGRDARADGLTPMPLNPVSSSPPDIPVANRDGSPLFVPRALPLPDDCCRYVGEAVAMVIADTAAVARAAAERVAVDYAPLAAVTDTAAALEPEAPRTWPGRADNLCLDMDIGDVAGTAAAMAGAAHVVRLRTPVARITGVPMEPRAATAAWDAATGRLTVWAGSGGPVRHKKEIAGILGLAEEAVRVIAGDVGGNYGTRNPLYPEFALVAWAARRLGRPVKWTADRSDAFLTDLQARDLVVDAALAFDADGRILAMRSDNVGNVGAYAYSFVPLVKGVEVMNLTYRIPAASARARAVTTNTAPTCPYRSAGRPEVVYVLERLLDLGARALGIDRVEIRRRNLIGPAEIPYDNGLGMTYDSGDFPQMVDRAVALGDWA